MATRSIGSGSFATLCGSCVESIQGDTTIGGASSSSTRSWRIGTKQFPRADVVGIQEIDGEQEQGATRAMQRVVQRVFPAFSRAYLGVDPDRRLRAQAHGQMLAKILRQLDVLVRVADEDPVPDVTDVHG